MQTKPPGNVLTLLRMPVLSVDIKNKPFLVFLNRIPSMDQMKATIVDGRGNSNLPQTGTVPVYHVGAGFDAQPEVMVIVSEAPSNVKASRVDLGTQSEPSCPPSYGEVCVSEQVNSNLGSQRDQPISIVVNNGHGLRQFHGGPGEDVDEFFQDFEAYFTTTKLIETQKLDRLVASLGGAAKKCFWANKTLNPNISYAGMKVLIVKSFKAVRPGLFNRAAMENRKQYSNESLDSFLWDKISLCQKVDPPMGEKEMIQVVMAGLNDSNVVAQLYSDESLDTFEKFRTKLVMISEGKRFAEKNQEVSTFNAAETLPVPQEKFLPHFEGSGPVPQRGRGNRRFRGRQRSYDQRGQRPQEPYLCWGCSKPGHYRRDCPNDQSKNQQLAGGQGEGRRQGN